MSELQTITETLERAARRRRTEHALRGLWVGLLIGALLWLVALTVFKLAPISASILLWSGLAALACPLGGVVFGFWRKPGLSETARWVDVKQNLKERMSTALEVAEKENSGTWRDLVMHDAVTHANEIDPRRLVPLHLTKAARWAVLVLALAAGLGFVPEYRSKAFVQKQADAQVIKEAGKQVADLTKRELQQRPPALEQTKKSLEAVSELGEKLEKMSLTRSDALKDLASASDKLKNELKDMAKDPGLKKLEETARSSGQAQTATGLQKQMESLQKQLSSQAGNPEALDKLQKNLEKLQAAAKAMADKTGEAAEAEQQKLSAALSALSQEAAEAGVQLPDLNEAIEALAANQTDRFMKELEAALTDLEKLRDMKQKLEAMQAQAEKLGKDLAEQLKNGQAEAAAATLRKLSEQLKSANLSQEQQQKILDEVAKALPEAQEYGKVADLLKQGTKQMQQGDKSNASQSLADAAKELEDLLQQMNDAQQMMAALDSLDKASMCISQCKGWGQCQGTRPGYNPFAKNGMGPGVGTWGEEGGEWVDSYDDGTGNIDRSALNDRDQAGRGQTDREQTDNSDRLQPTKVKGQFTPGGQMPSITLKGVSIKGTSQVAYEEAAAAAQSDAQSALSQEKVPRAYQGAVKDYFDDLPKK
ncbi:MAG TPA: hypothetical protein VFZ59_03050 [Verrucomicrobiae bacterium]|nr:hypothetical protein [Verrucomicrobiae bacterium]